MALRLSGVHSNCPSGRYRSQFPAIDFVQILSRSCLGDTGASPSARARPSATAIVALMTPSPGGTPLHRCLRSARASCYADLGALPSCPSASIRSSPQALLREGRPRFAALRSKPHISLCRGRLRDEGWPAQAPFDRISGDGGPAAIARNIASDNWPWQHHGSCPLGPIGAIRE